MTDQAVLEKSIDIRVVPVPGARRFNVASMSRDGLISLTEDCAKVTGIPCVMDAGREEAMANLEA